MSVTPLRVWYRHFGPWSLLGVTASAPRCNKVARQAAFASLAGSGWLRRGSLRSSLQESWHASPPSHPSQARAVYGVAASAPRCNKVARQAVASERSEERRLVEAGGIEPPSE